MKKAVVTTVAMMFLLAVFALGCTAGDSAESAVPVDLEDVVVVEQAVTPADIGHNFGRLIDARDQQKYKTIKIGNQVWMAENLNYETADSWCYDNDPDNCEAYGRLYSWETALIACPPDWHLPSDEEWKELIEYLTDNVGGKMKATGPDSWKSPNLGATNESGFTALPGGFRNNNASFLQAGGYGFWWSSTGNIPRHALTRYLRYSCSTVSRYNFFNRNAFSVRCIKD